MAAPDDALSQLRHVVGDIGDERLMAILALAPSIEEVIEAVEWADGDADTRGDGQWPLSGKTAEIFEILTSDFEDDARAH